MKDKMIGWVRANPFICITIICVISVLFATFSTHKIVTKSYMESTEREISRIKTSYEQKITNLTHDTNIEIATIESRTKEEIEKSRSKIEQLTNENSTLRQYSKRKTVKIVKPDGTIIEREYQENDYEAVSNVAKQTKKEFEQELIKSENILKQKYGKQVDKIKQEHKSTVETLQSEIDQLKKSKESVTTVVANPKKLQLVGGVGLDLQWFGGFRYKLWGPFSVGGDIFMDKTNWSYLGLGIGLEL